jgi:predicted transcriptional regulator
MTIRLDRQTRLRIERLARSTARSQAYLAQEAIRTFLDVNEWQVAAIEEGLRAADDGRLIDHDPVESWLASWGGRKEKGPPK